MGLQHIRKHGLVVPGLSELYIDPTTCPHWEIFKGDNKPKTIDADRKDLLRILTKQILDPEHSGKPLKNVAEDQASKKAFPSAYAHTQISYPPE